jgi:hypothetical protein
MAWWQMIAVRWMQIAADGMAASMAADGMVADDCR